MNRFYLLFTAFIILSMNIIPCSDMLAGNSETVITSQEAQEHHEEHQDTCPPFCFCDCCSMSVEPNSLMPILCDIGIYKNPVFDFYKSDYITAYQISIFQPPRIS